MHYTEKSHFIYSMDNLPNILPSVLPNGCAESRKKLRIAELPDIMSTYKPLVEILGAVVQLDALPVSLVHKKHKLVLIVQRAHRISNNDNYDNIYPAAENVNRRSERAKKGASNGAVPRTLFSDGAWVTHSCGRHPQAVRARCGPGAYTFSLRKIPLIFLKMRAASYL